MKNLILATVLSLCLSGCASPEQQAANLDTYQGGAYCTRQIDHPQPEIFRIGLPRASYKPQASDCEVKYAGNDKRVRACRIMRCDQFMQAGH